MAHIIKCMRVHDIFVVTSEEVLLCAWYAAHDSQQHVQCNPIDAKTTGGKSDHSLPN